MDISGDALPKHAERDGGHLQHVPGPPEGETQETKRYSSQSKLPSIVCLISSRKSKTIYACYRQYLIFDKQSRENDNFSNHIIVL